MVCGGRSLSPGSMTGLGRACRQLPSADGYHLSTAPKSRTAAHTRKQSAGTMPETCTEMWRSVSQYSSGTTLERAGSAVVAQLPARASQGSPTAGNRRNLSTRCVSVTKSPSRHRLPGSAYLMRCQDRTRRTSRLQAPHSTRVSTRGSTSGCEHCIHSVWVGHSSVCQHVVVGTALLSARPQVLPALIPTTDY